MNGPGGQWAIGDPRPIGPVPPSCFLPPRQLKPAPYKRDTRSMVASIALAHRVYNYDDQNLCRVTVVFFLLTLYHHTKCSCISLCGCGV